MEDFVRRWNMDGYEREWPPMASLSDPDRRGLVNEAGFVLFSKLIEYKQKVARAKASDIVKYAFNEAANYVYGINDAENHSAFNLVEKREAIVIAGRLHNLFRPLKADKKVLVGPKFRGSGLISNCVGDVLVEQEALYEIKSGDRKTRSVDYRQLAIYAALIFAETGGVVKNISVVNPRTGVIVSVPTEDFSKEVSGQSAVSLFHSLVEAFSANLISL